MRNLSLLLSVGALLALVSCKRDNPKPLDLPGQPFDASLTEVRSSKTFHWQVLQDDGGHWITDNGEESIRTLYVTAYNSPVVLETTAEVNIESSDAKVIAVVRKEEGNNRIFHLVYKGEGQTTIRLWNGSGASAVTKTFRVESRDKIEVEGLWFRYGYNHRVSENPNLTEPYPFTEAEDLIVKHPLTSRPNNIIACEEDILSGNEDRGRPKFCDFSILPYKRPVWYVWVDENDHSKGDMMIRDITSGCELEFVGLYPENCSFRRILAFESEWDFRGHRTQGDIRMGYIKEGDEYTHWPNVKDCNVDVSEFCGRKLWVPSAGDEYVALVKVDTPSPRYFFMSHVKED